MSTYAQGPDALNVHVLSVALIGPEQQRRQAVAMVLAGSQASVTREFSAYPQLDDVPQLLDAGYDVIIVDLDSDQERALDLVEHICGNSSVTVMVYSRQSDPELLVRCMRAGAREFLIQPIAASTIAEALVRASVRRPVKKPSKKALGKLLVFAGAKGGSGVSTVAGNFAISLARESSHSTLLLDLDLPLGAAALDLGITSQFSTVNALQNISRLDSHFLSTMLAKHSSGLSVLSAPDQYTPINASDEAIAKLLTVARQDFDYVVVDAGSSTRINKSLLEGATTVYFIAQVSISELRNANRMISEVFAPLGPRLEIVLNRYAPSSVGIDEENITKALTRPVTWKIPSDYRAVQRAQNTATPLAQGESPVAEIIRQMARTACGLPAVPDKKRKFSLFG
ncbi:pilus assembly protein CpaE [Edaphobacter acidisoli]|uniref:Pilus assembly protein CpaE n=1 Tax=Edaphobacter acidisoli TaxID=2040573 RepID=A0A916RL24_9BACT|nr:AAA family ATPase [Edaphobacter acidisoli]GGA61300.1 pilus assembly protein CpaE [Edaphobacter acidisoli]